MCVCVCVCVRARARACVCARDTAVREGGKGRQDDAVDVTCPIGSHLLYPCPMPAAALSVCAQSSRHCTHHTHACSPRGSRSDDDRHACVCVRAHLWMCAFVCMCMCVRARVLHACVCVRARVCIHVHGCVRVCACGHAHACMCACVHVCMCACAHACMCACVHECMRAYAHVLRS